jgi:hypothetical protein
MSSQQLTSISVIEDSSKYSPHVRKSKRMRFFAATGALLAIFLFAPRAFGQCTESCPGSVTCANQLIANGSPTTGRVDRDGIKTACGGGPSCTNNQALVDGRVKVFTFTNNTGGASPDCFTVSITTTCSGNDGLVSAAYLGTFDATGACANQIADMGDNTGLPNNGTTNPVTYSFNVANGATIFIGVWNRVSGTFCAAPYTLTISPCPLSPTAADGSIGGRITDSNGAAVAGATINLSGSQARKTITDANGNYHFDNVESNGFYTVKPSRVNYSFSPAERSFSQLGNSTEAAFTAVPIDDGVNPLDTPEYFVRQHYLDFLGREPDESGFNFWSDQMLECGVDAGCSERRRINVSAAYFLSIEFQQTGGLVDGLYRASYGVRPQFAEFMPDIATIARDVVVGRTGWEQLLAANKQAFLDEWVNRPAFRAAYDLLTNDRYVDALIAHTGVSFTPSERDALVNGLTLGTLTRAGVLQRIAEDERFVEAKRNEVFVMMEYFAYLRRDPDASGFAFWLNKLNEFGGNFEQAEMVKAFIVSSEYRGRFSQ